MGFIRDIGWVFLWLSVAGVGAYAMNTLGFRDYIDGILAVFNKYNSNEGSVENDSDVDNKSNSFVTTSVRLTDQ